MPAVLVTGASSGIGRACALRLVAAGHLVFAGVRRDVDAEALHRDAPRVGGRLETVELDVTDEAQVGEALDRVGRRLDGRRFAGVVNNAGVAIGGPVEYLGLDWWRTQLEVNVIGQVAVTKAALPLVRDGCGRIVFIGSNSGRVATPMMAPYCASKFAIEGLAESLRHELADWSIPVVVVEPGAIRTPIWDKGRDLADRLDADLPPEAHERYARFIAMIRRALDHQEQAGIDPDRVARVVERALTVERPRARYQVGMDATVGALAARFLPDRVRDAAVAATAERI